jgi:hypothetical protein
MSLFIYMMLWCTSWMCLSTLAFTSVPWSLSFSICLILFVAFCKCIRNATLRCCPAAPPYADSVSHLNKSLFIKKKNTRLKSQVLHLFQRVTTATMRAHMAKTRYLRTRRSLFIFMKLVFTSWMCLSTLAFTSVPWSLSFAFCRCIRNATLWCCPAAPAAPPYADSVSHLNKSLFIKKKHKT